MLDFVSSTPEGVHSRIPMDLSQYLLASSPPSFAFDFMALSLQHQQHSHQQSQSSVASASAAIYQSSINPTCPFHHSVSYVNENSQRCPQKQGALKPIIIRSDSCCSSDSEGESSSESRPHSPGRTPKKVSFADHKGLALAQVRFVNEGPDEPPQLNSRVLSLLTQGATAGVSSRPPIKLCFPQPASDYMAFRDRVFHHFVSLENVILEDYTVKGTVKVKNITFEKSVFVRMSMDDWSSFEDHSAVFVPGPGSGFSNSNDTFSFVMEIPPKFDVSKTIQFAVCFKENGKEHWDSNNGSNYSIVFDSCEVESKESESPVIPVSSRWLPEKSSDHWSEFSVCRDIGDFSRYY